MLNVQQVIQFAQILAIGTGTVPYRLVSTVVLLQQYARIRLHAMAIILLVCVSFAMRVKLTVRTSASSSGAQCPIRA